MADAIIGAVLNQLVSVLDQQVRQEYRLVVGVDKDIKNLEDTFKSIEAVLVDAEKRQVKEENVKLWLQKLQDVSYDMDDVLAEWSAAILKIQIEELENASPKKKVCFFITFPCFCFSRVVFRHDIAIKIKEINEKLNLIAAEKDKYSFSMIRSSEGLERLKTTSYVEVKEVCGRDGDKSNLVKELLKENSQAERGFHLISIVGMGGIGKTTLAQFAYNCEEVTSHFVMRMWVCVSEPFEVVKIAKAILEDVADEAPKVYELETVMRHLRENIKGKKFLLVLDDVWTDDYGKWEPLRSSLGVGASGSKVLVTTRNERVARMMGSSHMLRLGELTELHCWSLFSQFAFFERSRENLKELEVIGRGIAKKCKGLPLAAKTIGSLMRFKNSVQDWQNVLDSDMWNLEEAERGVFPPLLLSYFELPSAQKRCFSYCANFPKDYKIEADNLIKLWMAQGFLISKENVEMEAIGRQYLDNLVMRCFFQEVEKGKGSDEIVRFKMHDMVHDFAQYITKKESYIMEVDSELVPRINSSCGKARHLTLVRSEDATIPASFGNTDKLHTFWIQSFYDCPALVSEEDKLSPDVFQHLLHLKALDFSRNRFLELPKEMGKLLNLRYLNLSHNPLGELPETVCELCNLQTLKLVACERLAKLPQGIGKLMNLRHLEIDRTDNLKVFPKGIGRLRSLQTLNKFVLACNRDAEEMMCKLGDLKDLNQLRGCLKIEGLGLVTNVADAKKAELKNKKNLVELYLDFKTPLQTEGITEVAEALQLHPDLQHLEISFFGGTRFPSWMTSMTNLRKLRLQDCQICTHLPPLGRLPSLEVLCIENMHELKRIGVEFLGVGLDRNAVTNANGALATSAVSGTTINIFPKLKKLKFDGMRNWEEWELISTERNVQRVMPCLRYLKLSGCSKLKALPDPLLQKKTIRKLRIHRCPLLEQQYQKGNGETWIKISHIHKVRIS